jgi:hypothetical protein
MRKLDLGDGQVRSIESEVGRGDVDGNTWSSACKWRYNMWMVLFIQFGFSHVRSIKANGSRDR